MPFGWAAAGVAAAGTIYSATQNASAQATAADQAAAAGANAEYKGMLQKNLNDMEAEAVMKQAQEQVALIRRQSASMRASLVSAQAGSGAVIGEGSAQAAVDQIEMLASADALAALYSGVNKANTIKTNGRWAAESGTAEYKNALNQGSSLRSSANTTLIAGFASAVGQLGGAYAKLGNPLASSTSTGVNSSAGTPDMSNKA